MIFAPCYFIIIAKVSKLQHQLTWLQDENGSTLRQREAEVAQVIWFFAVRYIITLVRCLHCQAREEMEQLRSQLNGTQIQAAEAAGVHRGTVSVKTRICKHSKLFSI